MKAHSILSFSLCPIVLALAACGGGGGGNGASSGASVAASGNSASAGSAAAGASAGSAGSGSGSATTVVGAAVAVSPAVVSAAAASMSCGTPVAGAAASGSDLISVDTPSADGTRMFASGSTFNLAITTRASSADKLTWTVSNVFGNPIASGSVATPAGASTATISCTSTVSGYFAVSATLANVGGSVQTAGTRPTGFATFGVLPDVSASIGVPTYGTQEQHRFGMQGFNGWTAMLTALGISSTIDDREISSTEPNGPNTFTASATTTDDGYASGKIMRLVRLDGIPAWDSPTGAYNDSLYLPKDQAGYQSYMTQVGSETEAMRQKYLPKMASNYYQVTWEPNGRWADTDANFVQLYKLAYQGLHAGDPHAVVMGPTDAFPSLTTQRLKTMAPLGLAQYLDGIATHGYYDAGTMPSHPPERLATDPDPANAANALPNEIRNLRQEMQADYKPGMKLFVTETGISYDLGSSYGPNYPSANILFAQGALVARTHIIMLGEGADQTYVFYGADYPGEVGYGTFFDLDHAQGAFGATNVSPKPAALALATTTRLLDGTVTLGPVTGTPSGVYAYAFQQRGTGNAVTALWTHNNAVWSAGSGFSQTYTVGYNLTVDSPGTSGTVQVLDMMGNASTVSYSNGVVSLNLSESPIYVVSRNVAVSSANAVRPVGYVGS